MIYLGRMIFYGCVSLDQNGWKLYDPLEQRANIIYMN